MPERRDTNLFEILIGQVTQNLEVNIILGKALSVLPETELFEPVRNLLHRRPSSDLGLSVLDRHVGKFTNTRQDRVARASPQACQTEEAVATFFGQTVTSSLFRHWTMIGMESVLSPV